MSYNIGDWVTVKRIGTKMDGKPMLPYVRRSLERDLKGVTFQIDRIKKYEYDRRRKLYTRMSDTRLPWLGGWELRKATEQEIALVVL